MGKMYFDGLPEAKERLPEASAPQAFAPSDKNSLLTSAAPGPGPEDIRLQLAYLSMGYGVFYLKPGILPKNPSWPAAWGQPFERLF